MKESRARGLITAAAVAALLTTAGCGAERQDANEPEGKFKVSVTDASFPAKQSIAQRARFKVEVRNDDKRSLPNVAVTVKTRPGRTGAAPLAFGQAATDTRLADTEKPVWIVDTGPVGGDSAYTNTWSLGPMSPGETKTFTWKLTAVKAGRYTVTYRVAPGLNGKAQAARGARTSGLFRVTISDEPVPAHVDDNGKVVRGEEAGSGSGL